MYTPNVCLGLLCFGCVACVNSAKNRGESEEGLSPHAQMGNFPSGQFVHLLVIVPDHFHIPNFFNQSFIHMDSSLE